jgi:catechol 2,3-dioxygenase-like lactoylglutathione lyase family enzyme
MRTDCLLHYAFRARDPDRLGAFYADVFEGQYFLHPVMTGLGIVIVKLNHPEAVFAGLLEFWPWDVVWDSSAAVFRRIKPQPSPTSYGHLAVKVNAPTEEVTAELDRRGITYRMEPRSLDLFIPTIDDPEGNMIELFPNVDTMPLPPEALCPPAQAPLLMAALRQRFARLTAHLPPEQGYPLFLAE